jgi:hypothetical protein
MKSHKEFDQIKPYSYLVRQKSTGKLYYGIRWKNWSKHNTTPTQDFWVTYFTSSDNIKNEIKLKGLTDFEVQVRQTFDSPEEADAWEKKLLIRVKALDNQDLWWNGNIGTNKVVTESGRKKISQRHSGVPKSEEHKNKISTAQKGKPKKSQAYKSEDYRRRNSERNRGENNPMYGKPCTPERAANISKAKKAQNLKAHNKGIPCSEEQKQKIRETKEKNKNLLTCPVCGKTMRESHYKMYGHGPDCTMKQCPHCKEYHAKTKYDAAHGDKCNLNPNRAKPFVPRKKIKPQ